MIQIFPTIKTLSRLTCRVTRVLMNSLMKLNGLGLPMPDRTDMSRRVASLTVSVPRQTRCDAIHVTVDPTGLTIFDEAEWKLHQHDVGKRRTWRKTHLADDESARDTISIEANASEWDDSEAFATLLNQVADVVGRAYGDSACDTEGTYASTAERGVNNRGGWTKGSGYHRVSVAKNVIYRY